MFSPTRATSGRSGFLWPFSPRFLRFFKLPGMSGSMLRRGRVLDRPGARTSRAGARARKPWALSKMSRGRGGGRVLAWPAGSLTPAAGVPRELTLACQTCFSHSPSPTHLFIPPPCCQNARQGLWVSRSTEKWTGGEFYRPPDVEGKGGSRGWNRGVWRGPFQKVRSASAKGDRGLRGERSRCRAPEAGRKQNEKSEASCLSGGRFLCAKVLLTLTAGHWGVGVSVRCLGSWAPSSCKSPKLKQMAWTSKEDDPRPGGLRCPESPLPFGWAWGPDCAHIPSCPCPAQPSGIPGVPPFLPTWSLSRLPVQGSLRISPLLHLVPHVLPPLTRLRKSPLGPFERQLTPGLYFPSTEKGNGTRRPLPEGTDPLDPEWTPPPGRLRSVSPRRRGSPLGSAPAPRPGSPGPCTRPLPQPQPQKAHHRGRSPRRLASSLGLPTPTAPDTAASAVVTHWAGGGRGETCWASSCPAASQCPGRGGTRRVTIAPPAPTGGSNLRHPPALPGLLRPASPSPVLCAVRIARRAPRRRTRGQSFYHSVSCPL